MKPEELEKILKQFKAGKKTLKETKTALKDFPIYDMGFAKIDTHRELRQGFPEVIFCQGKSQEQIKGIIEKTKDHPLIMSTRATPETFKMVKEIRKDSVYDPEARIIVSGKVKKKTKKKILALTAGTADIPVASEAALTAEVMGNTVEKIFDVGVAGIHRLFAHKESITQANVIVVAAGMEGALASVVGGLVSCPVIAVPTSVGYGANFGGVAPLLTMLNSCAPGVTVVNIDNGFGAGYMASLINNMNTKR